MQVVDEFPRTVREIENVFIELADGCRLAARIWLPADAEADPVPAILEYLPYRKRDGTSLRDALTHPYVAGHGAVGEDVVLVGRALVGHLVCVDRERFLEEQGPCHVARAARGAPCQAVQALLEMASQGCRAE